MRFNKSFLMTLGHNSSVIFFDGSSKPIGYEEERLTNKKSDSSYPFMAFTKLLSKLSYDDICGSNVFISHWFDKFDLSEFPSKYFNHEHFNEVVEKFKLNVVSLNSQFTHHDAHAWSTKAFMENFPFEVNINSSFHHIVLDGFGNNQEVMSIYEVCEGDLKPIHRVYGFNNSLGLMYQYATSFCGMKENQDEYKFLGYEVKIEKFLAREGIALLNKVADKFSSDYVNRCLMLKTQKPEATDSIINYIELNNTKSAMYEFFENTINLVSDSYIHEDLFSNEDSLRTVIGYFVQKCLEETVLKVLDFFNIKNACLSGGCFYNVKLNKLVLDNIKGQVCVNPLSGDQGAAIGLFRRYTKSAFNYSDLCFGVREKFKTTPSLVEHLKSKQVFVFDDEENASKFISSALNEDKIVNLIQGNMEFGPRALCNTSTLAKPTKENSMYINKVNNRNEVMPMAPVMRFGKSYELLCIEDLYRVIGSNRFMIITHDFAGTGSYPMGVLHSKPLKTGYTCRPQVLVDKHNIVFEVLANVDADCLINTSFNTHGRPILYSVESAIEDFRIQKKRDNENRLVLVILNQ